MTMINDVLKLYAEKEATNPPEAVKEARSTFINEMIKDGSLSESEGRALNGLNEGRLSVFQAINEVRNDYKNSVAKTKNPYIEYVRNDTPVEQFKKAALTHLPVSKTDIRDEVYRVIDAGNLTTSEAELFKGYVKGEVKADEIKAGILSVAKSRQELHEKIDAITKSDEENHMKRNLLREAISNENHGGSLTKNEMKAYDKFVDKNFYDAPNKEQLTLHRNSFTNQSFFAKRASEALMDVVEKQEAKSIEGVKEVANPGQDASVKRDLRQDFTDKLVASLEKGTIPWRKPWDTEKAMSTAFPTNASTGKMYRGGNLLALAVEAIDKKYEDSRWGTFNQIKALGGNVKRGERATAIEYWERKPFYTRKDVEVYGNNKRVYFDEKAQQNATTITSKDGRVLSKSDLSVVSGNKTYSWRQAEATLDILVQKTHFVFNVEQAENLQLPALNKEMSELEKHSKAENIAKGMEKDGLKITHGMSEGAFYSPAADVVSMPNKGSFENEQGYYGTLLHELGHATGHEDRLKRDMGKQFGTEGYAKEELVAELTSAFTSMETGVPFDGANHEAYIKNWAEVLKNDKNAIYVAARDASKASDYLIEKGKEVELTLEQKHTHSIDSEVTKEEVGIKNTVMPIPAPLDANFDNSPQPPKAGTQVKGDGPQPPRAGTQVKKEGPQPPSLSRKGPSYDMGM